MKYFTLKELFNSSTARAHGIDNTTKDKTVLKNLNALVDNLLDPLRETFGQPIIVTSGYRCLQLNNLIKGSLTSNHLKGCAADIVTKNGEEDLAYLCGIVLRDFDFDEVIFESSGKSKWLHVAYRRNINRGKALFYSNGKYSIMSEATRKHYISLANERYPKRTN